MTLRDYIPTPNFRDMLRSGTLLTFQGASIVAFVVLLGLLVFITGVASGPAAIALATFILFFMLRAIFPTERIDAFIHSLMTGEAGERLYYWLAAKLGALWGWRPW